MQKKPGDLLTGLTAVVLFAWIFFRTDPVQFITSVALLSICTLGVPVILLFSISYADGSIINSFIFNGGWNGIENNRDRILEDYIRSSRRNGMDKETIARKLIEIGGWKAEEVREVCDKPGVG